MFGRILGFLLLLTLAGCVSEPLPEGFERSNDFDQVEAAKTRISLGLTYLKNGNYTQAKLNLDKALEFAPRLADAHYSLAYYYQLVEEVKRAEQSYQNALDLDPRNPDIANSYGAFLCQQGRYDQAKKFFMQAVNSQTYANSAETYENIALCSLSQERPNEAIEYLQTALKHQPTRAKSLFLLAELQIDQEQYALAKQTLARYQRVARVSAETLWMQVQIAQGLDQQDDAKGYGEMLMRMYPRHPLTQRYLANLTKPQVTNKVAAQPTVESKPAPPVESESPITNEPTLPVADEETSNIVEASEASEHNEISAVKADESASENDEAGAAGTTDTAVNETADVTTISTEPLTEANPLVDSEQSVTKELEEQASTQSTTNASESAADESSTQHVVSAGENLYRISLRYNVKMSSLIEWNQLPENGSIQRGMTLWVVDPATLSNE
ncbi:type IV pilus biogenesis/stability protein PilW [Alteromonas flava]|uniref:type IV pilus biogenesis/stability protein PilW n=1 Tax=Alteromonas flava TaxID=2048003 RepID=UPI000C28B609|nr:type IV pilus biogenesis/stability protein PilW [Alteromonas flava]